jgi:hypothetical protein
LGFWSSSFGKMLVPLPKPSFPKSNPVPIRFWVTQSGTDG